MKKYFPFLVLVLLLLAAAHAAPLERDLGEGLAYHRVHHLPADLPTGEAAHQQPCVLDLRYATGDAQAAAALTAWLKFNATTHAPVFVLANAETDAALRAAIAPHGTGVSVVVLGVASAGFTPDIALQISPEVERQAYDALEHGATIDSLITDNRDKPRNDEAQLAKDRQTDAPAADDAQAPVAPADDATKPKHPPPLIDAVLLRAVQLHRALLALKKL